MSQRSRSYRTSDLVSRPSTTLIRFQPSTPGITELSLRVGGLASGERILGMDFRDADQRLYGISNMSRVYRIDTATAVATAISSAPFTPALEPTPGEYVAVSFIPGTDILRVVNATAQNLRVSVVDGTAVVDTRVIVGGNVPSAVAIAHTGTGASTVLYVIDGLFDVLMRSTNPNSGVLQTVGALGVEVEEAAFDIGGSPAVGYGAITPNTNGVATFSRINLDTAALTSVGLISKPSGLLKAIAIFP